MHDITTSNTPQVIPHVGPQSKKILSAMRNYKNSPLDKDKQSERDRIHTPHLQEVNYPLKRSAHKRKVRDQVLDIPSFNEQCGKYGMSKTQSQVLVSRKNQAENSKAVKNQSQKHISNDVDHIADVHHNLSKSMLVPSNIKQLGKQPVINSACAPIKESTTVSKKKPLFGPSSAIGTAANMDDCNPSKRLRNDAFPTHNNAPSSSTSSTGSGVHEIVPDAKATRKRSHTLCHRLWNKKDDNKITIMMNKNGKPIGKEENYLASFLGTVARNSKMAPLNYKDWRLLPGEKKEKMLQFVESKFNFDKKMRKWVMWSISKKWRDFKCELKREFYKPHLTIEERLENRDCRVAVEQWKFLNEYWDSEEAKAHCAKNKNSRNKLKMSHTAGTQTFSCVQHTLEQKKGGPINQLELFIEVHKRKDGNPVNEAAKEIISQFDSAIEELDDSMDATTIDDIYYKVTGKKPTDYSQSDKVAALQTNSEGSDSNQIKKKELQLKLENHQREMESQRQEINYLKEKQKILELMILNRSREKRRELQKNRETNCASLESYRGSSLSGGRKFSESLTSEGKDVFIMSFDNSELKVAMGQVCLVDPISSIDGTQLGSKFVGVRVEVALEEDEPLLRPFNQYRTIGDARGTIIAWPKKLIIERN